MTAGLRSLTIRGVISTDDILPARYKHTTTNPSDLAEHIFENILPNFTNRIIDNTVIIATDLFGIGSSREQAVSALKAAGIQAIIAPRFGRIFFRNCWNLALPALECTVPNVTDGSEVSLDMNTGEAIFHGFTCRFSAPPRQMLDLLQGGGLLSVLKTNLCH